MVTLLQEDTVWTRSLASGFCFPLCEMEMAAKEVKGRDGGRSWQAETYGKLSTSICQGKLLQAETDSFSDTFVFLVGLSVQKIV